MNSFLMNSNVKTGANLHFILIRSNKTQIKIFIS